MRPDWDEYFMLVAKLAAVRSTCNSRPQGAVIVRDKRVITTGYNGALPDRSHCLGKTRSCPACNGQGKWTQNLLEKLELPTSYTCKICKGSGQIPYCHRRATGTPDSQKDRACVSAHAEANAIAQAATMGISTYGADLYCTTRPCAVCTKLLVQAGIRQVFYEMDYDDPPDCHEDKIPSYKMQVGPQALEQAWAVLQSNTSRRRLERTK